MPDTEFKKEEHPINRIIIDNKCHELVEDNADFIGCDQCSLDAICDDCNKCIVDLLYKKRDCHFELR